MIEYRIYLGEATISDCIDIVAGRVEGATLHPIHGIWKGQVEYGTLIIVLGEAILTPIITELAFTLKEHFKQEAVLVTSAPVNSLLV